MTHRIFLCLALAFVVLPAGCGEDERPQSGAAGPSAPSGGPDGSSSPAADARPAEWWLAQAAEAAPKIADPERKGYAYYGIAIEQAELGEKDAAKKTCNDALAFIKATPAIAGEYGLYNSIAEAQARAGDAEEAKKSFALAMEAAGNHNLPDDRARDMTRVARAQADNGFIDDAKESFAQAVSVAGRIDDDFDKWFRLLMVSEEQFDAGLTSDAMNTAGEIVDEYHSSQAFEYMAEAFAGSGKISDALDVAGRITDKSEKYAAYLAIAEARAKARDTDGAKATLKKAADCIDTSSPWGETQNRIEIAKAQAKLGDMESAATTFEQAFTVAKTITAFGDRVAALRDIVLAAAEADCRDAAAEPLALATEAAHNAEAGEQRADSLQKVAAAQAALGNLDDVKKTCDEALAECAKIPGEPEKRDPCIQLTAYALADAGLFDEAMKTVEGMKETHRRALSCHAIAETALKKGSLADAATAAHGAEDGEDKANTFRDIAAAWAKKGDAGTARVMFGKAYGTALKITDEWRRAYTIRGIAAAQAVADTGWLEKAFDALKDETPLVRHWFCRGVLGAIKKESQ